MAVVGAETGPGDGRGGRKTLTVRAPSVRSLVADPHRAGDPQRVRHQVPGPLENEPMGAWPPSYRARFSQPARLREDPETGSIPWPPPSLDSRNRVSFASTTLFPAKYGRIDRALDPAGVAFFQDRMPPR